MAEKDFDDILTQLKLGPWNFLYYFTIGIVYFTLTAQAFSSVFVVPNMEFRCDTEDIDGAINENDQCSYYFNETGVVEKYNATEVKCTKWVYEDEYFTDTITQEFNLICDKSYLRPTFMSIHVIGKTIGSPLNGFLADRYGRKKLLSVTSLVAVLNFLLSTFLTNFYAILATRVITGVVISPIFQTGFIMCLEATPPHSRTTVGMLLSIPWAIGFIWLGFLGYMVRDWRWLMRASTGTAIFFFISFFFLEESPRWNVVRGNDAKAMKSLKKAARWNRSTLPSDEELLEEMERCRREAKVKLKEQETKEKKSTRKKVIEILKKCFLLCRTPEMRKRTLLIYSIFAGSIFVYVGLTFNAVNFDLNPFLYMAVSGLIEIPAYVLPIPILKRYGRIFPCMFCFFFCGAAIMILAFIPTEPKWLIILLAMSGKLGITAAFAIIYIVATESFPTEVRMQGLGTSALATIIGSFISPYITELVGEKHPWMPSVIFGGISLAAGGLTFFVPETVDTHLPETVMQLEDEAKLAKGRATKQETIPIAT